MCVASHRIEVQKQNIEIIRHTTAVCLVVVVVVVFVVHEREDAAPFIYTHTHNHIFCQQSTIPNESKRPKKSTNETHKKKLFSTDHTSLAASHLLFIYFFTSQPHRRPLSAAVSSSTINIDCLFSLSLSHSLCFVRIFEFSYSIFRVRVRAGECVYVCVHVPNSGSRLCCSQINYCVCLELCVRSVPSGSASKTIETHGQSETRKEKPNVKRHHEEENKLTLICARKQRRSRQFATRPHCSKLNFVQNGSQTRIAMALNRLALIVLLSMKNWNGKPQ